MNISVTDAQTQLTDLVRRAEAGDDIVLTQDGQPAVRLVAVANRFYTELSKEERAELIRRMQASIAAKGPPDTSAARSQDFLYDEFGLPI